MGKFIDRPRYVCALGGAIATLRAIPKVVPILHSAAGCGGNLAVALNAGAGVGGNAYCGGMSLPSSNVSENEVVFGGVDRLREQLETTLEVMEADLYVVVTGCVVEMIGDDVESTVKEFNRSRTLESNDSLSQKEVLYVGTPSFSGTSYTGYDLIMSGLAEHYVKKTEEKKTGKVNILGIAPMLDPHWSGNLRELKYILQKIGLSVNTFFGEGESLEDIKNAGDAALNIVVSDVYGIKPAQVFEDIHKIPYIKTPLPIGALSTEKFVREVGKRLGVSEQLIDKVINEENQVYFSYFERLAEDYNDGNLQRYAVVIGDANYAQAVTRFISDELGFLPRLAVITDPLEEEAQQALRERFENLESGLKVEVRFDTDTSSVKKHLWDVWPQDNNEKYYEPFSPAVVYGSSFDRVFSEKIKSPLIQTTFPIAGKAILDKPLAGFRGGLYLTGETFSTILSAAIKLNQY